MPLFGNGSLPNLSAPMQMMSNQMLQCEHSLNYDYANRTFYVFLVLRIISGPRVKFVQ